MTASRTGAEAFCDALEREGVECVFGLPGTQMVEIYDALRSSRIRSIVPTHELSAAFMANGYARASGKPGVLLTISGPGVAFAPAGLAEAKLDGVPLVHFTIAPAVGPTGEPAFQAFDQAAFARPIVKAVLRADERTQIARVVQEAFDIASARDPGPVFVEFTPRALRERGVDAPAERSTLPSAGDGSLDAIVEQVCVAKHPVFFVACECSEAAELLAGVATAGRVPVLVPAPYRGIVPEDHAWTLCCDEQRTSFDLIQEVVAAADLVIVLGTRLSHVATAGFRLKFSADRVVCISDNGGLLPHGYTAREYAESAPARALSGLANALPRFASTWTAQDVAQLQQRFTDATPSDPPEPTVEDKAPAVFFAALRAALPRDAFLVTDSGLHQVLARRHFPVLTPRGLLYPSDLQSMAFGLSAAIGAKLAAPTRTVVVVTGDGGFAMTGLELLTAARESVAVVVVVFNDGQLNLIRLQQIKEFGRPSGVELLVPDFQQIAEAVGVRYRKAGDDFTGAIQDAMKAGETTLIEVRVGDSREIVGVRAKSLARETVRRMIGQKGVSWIKKLR